MTSGPGLHAPMDALIARAEDLFPGGVNSPVRAGALSGHPLSMAAGIATLETLTSDRYLALEAASEELAEGLRSAASGGGREASVSQVGALFTIFFRSDIPDDAGEALQSDRGAFASFFGGMVDRGLLLPPSQFEAWFVSIAHGPVEVEETIAAAREVLSS